MLSIRSVLLAAALLGLSGAIAHAEKRIALLIGNSAYKNVPPLTNPVHDAAAMAAMFKAANFDIVESRVDLTVADMRRALREFGTKARDADIAVIYYAGHGIEFEGNNYLVPTDAALETDTDVFDETLALDRVLVTIEPAKQLRLVILDACRDNPFYRSMKRTIGSRSISRGLAKVEPSSPNTLIAFAAKAGFTADDGNTENSPFTFALSHHLTTPGLDLRKAFGFVRDDVLKATNNRQEPFIYGSLGGNDVALVPLASLPSPPQVDQEASMRMDYDLAERVSTKAVWDSFISKYPVGFYTELAKAQRDRIDATAKAKAASDEQTRLAVEGAKATEQAKAAELVRATDAARLAAEMTKKHEEQRVLEAERARAAAISQVKGQTVTTDQGGETTVATVNPNEKHQTDQPSSRELSRLVQIELHRLGCLTNASDGDWNVDSQHSLELFNRHVGSKPNLTIVNLDTLSTLKNTTERVCPLLCDHGFKVVGDRCAKITCTKGSFVNARNQCENRHDLVTVIRPGRQPRQNDVPAKPVEAEPTKPQLHETCGPFGCFFRP